jgi:dTDP-4-dehydrorhamnose 3,5-epimerase
MTDSSIFIAGANGQLGLALQAQYPGAKTADIDMLDITDRVSVEAFDWSSIKIILNAAAFTNVDGAESSEGRIAAWQVNAMAVSNLARMSIKHDITFVHVSTDYVFDGSQDSHTEEEPLSPLSVYGQSKAAGDIIVSLIPKHYLVRTSWVIGEGKNFVRTMLSLGQQGTTPTVVADQVGRLTFTSELVRAIDHLLSSNCPFGIYNVSNGGEPASWADITREIFADADINLAVSNTTTAEYYKGKQGVAPRPLSSTLALDKILSTGFSPRDWREDLKKYVAKEVNS